ncbi:MAG: hypothetical protein M3Q65_20870 [Chloroflexota bacterium]|nr:hypothetical protein [Chloroflexota bacterium]
MNERERAASNRRMVIVLGIGAALAALALGALFMVGKSVGAPTDSDSVARMAAEGMKQVGKTGEKTAAKLSASGEE